MTTWMVTGASRGLGARMVQDIVARGDRVAATARTIPDGDRGPSEQVLWVPMDVTNPDQVAAATADIEKRLGPVDVLVCNAGRGLVGAVEEISDAEARALFDTNFFGLLHVVRAVLPRMRERRSGRIVNISSVAGVRSVPGSGIYSATKHAVEGMSLALRAEVADFGVDVMVVEPGAFRTDFMSDSSMTFATQSLAAYENGKVGRVRRFAETGSGTEMGDPVKAARLIVEAASAPTMPHRLPVGRDALDIFDAVPKYSRTRQGRGVPRANRPPWTTAVLPRRWTPRPHRTDSARSRRCPLHSQLGVPHNAPACAANLAVVSRLASRHRVRRRGSHAERFRRASRQRGGERVSRPRGRSPRVAIIGGGFGGIGLAVHLHRAGIDTYTLFERADAVGGVWRENTYPGAEVDTPSHWYSFSFMQWDWPRTHGQQADLVAYLKAVVDRFDVRRHIRFETTVESTTWDENRHVHVVRLAGGEALEFDVVVSALGLFNVPRWPDWPGLDTFNGPVFHTARWEHQHELSDKSVAVVGTGSTGAQMSVVLSQQVKHLTIFQRDPGWVTPKGEREFSPDERRTFAGRRAYRRERRRNFMIEQRRFWAGKQMQPGTRQNAVGQRAGEKYIAETFAARPDLREAVTPNHPFFGKRPVRATGFYETLLRDNVTFVPRAVERVTPDGIVTTDRVEHPVDVIVLATGFRAAEYLAEIDVIGREGLSIHERWQGEPDAFLGVTVPQFPNFYMLFGPNTNMGTIVFNLETQAKYVVRDVQRMRRKGVTAIEVRESFHRRYNTWLQKALRKTVWANTRSYYAASSGKLVVPFPTAMSMYWAFTRLLRRVSAKDTTVERHAHRTPSSVTRDEPSSTVSR